MNRFWRTALYADVKLRTAGIPYCVIKSYGGNPKYADGNLDIVVGRGLGRIYQRAFAADYLVTSYDRMKSVLYERNKLMIKPRDSDRIPLHLHSFAGWHNICFMPAERILGNAIDLPLDGRSVRIAERSDEARIFVCHIIFEQYRVKDWDLRFLANSDFDDFAREHEIADIAPVRDAKAGPIALRHLRPIWRQYYRMRRGRDRISVWNRLLHWGYLVRRQLR